MRKSPGRSPILQVVLPREVAERIRALAKSQNRTVSNTAQTLIISALDNLEKKHQPTQARAA